MKNKIRWVTFWPLWILANGIGWSIIAVSFVLPFWSILVTFGIGFLISLLQWLVLKKYFDANSSWIWLSTLAYGFFIFVDLQTGINISFIRFLIINIFFLGLLGFLQETVLYPCIDNSSVWVVVSPAASIAGVIISQNIGSLSPAYFWAITGVVYGCITGAAILLLENKTIKNSTFPEN